LPEEEEEVKIIDSEARRREVKKSSHNRSQQVVLLNSRTRIGHEREHEARSENMIRTTSASKMI